MKVRKVIVTLLIAVMLISSMGMSAFAEIQAKDIPDAVVLVEVENPYCTEIVKIADKLQAVIKNELNGEERIIATVDVEKAQITGEDEMAIWLGVGVDAVEDDILKQLKEMQSEIDLKALLNMDLESEEDLAVAEEIATKLTELMTSYKVELTGPNGETYGEHYDLTEEGSTMGMVITSDLINTALEFAGMLLDVEVTESTTITEILEAALSFLFDEEVTLEELLAEMELTEEETAEIMEIVAQAEEVLAYMRSEDYEGTVFAGVTLICDCPYPDFDFEIDWSEWDWEYEIQHIYYAENEKGEMEVVGMANYGPEYYDFGDGTGYYYYPGEYGQVVSGYENRAEEFEGKTYEYVGSYDISLFEYYYDYETGILEDIPEEEWAYCEVEEFTLDENDDVYGLVLKYELVEEEDTGDVTDNSDVEQPGDTAEPDKEVSSEDVEDEDKTEDSAVPSTGDDSNIALYVVIAVIAAALGIYLMVSRKRKADK